MGITRSSFHKRRATGGKLKLWRKKRKFEMGRQPANTRIGTKRIRTVRTRGGHSKFRALRLEHGNFSWGSEGLTRKTRILDVVYNASNNELVRTKTLVKNAIVQIDATPFRQWYSAHYGLELGKKKAGEEAAAEVKKSKGLEKKLSKRRDARVIDQAVADQFKAGRLFACISSRPGQCGRSDGYILEGRELEFYVKKLQRRRGKGQ
mmetsp:Transcript_115299/g.162107  ORF Transcript_115299/g.162107 Transcript_115299/m.162107 type:complete len:206 (-) Transcript_115299:76-693(-)